jgi:uncharacterized spore protein YtfJ
MVDVPEALRAVAGIPEHATSQAVFGPVTTNGDTTVIPVGEVWYGFGFGFGGGSDPDTRVEGTGGGAGAGARARGVAVIELGPGGVRVHAVRDDTAISLAGIAFAAAATAITARTLVKLLRG